ncbi:hypothetical protein [Desulfofustis glycolicus]|uniref:Uncharacterized protein n=1 Tax=Desulfofustis glycolicus DSM 9705 TaxID=1121409 RepID=A0A1M5SC77_9BACT|nr:hypothetical protein [Desulfofustis glycolicus]MCB2216183.1 hypothetical protein [Desulfobulbaceae bacterium]SHH35513.1 hypothetical protein SAMN02745124_00247 [Desulfofustis glycolicus DSM 9705]
MHRHEIAFAKQGALATSDWDTYQTIIRTCLTDRRRSLPTGTVPLTTPPATQAAPGAAPPTRIRR